MDWDGGTSDYTHIEGDGSATDARKGATMAKKKEV
jgi:hypothetical protein